MPKTYKLICADHKNIHRCFITWFKNLYIIDAELQINAFLV